MFFLQRSYKELQKTRKDQRMAMETLSKAVETILKDMETIQKDKDKFEAHCEAELLRAKGVLTSRGVFERMAQLSWAEQKFRGTKFVCKVVLKKLCGNPTAGKWSQCMHESAKKCAPTVDPYDTLEAVWHELSDPVHGVSFSGLEVQVLDRVSDEGKCLLNSFCDMMGLPNSL